MNNAIGRNQIKPIFIVGCPRSGTTLLQQLLNAHKMVAIAPETFFIKRFWLEQERYKDLEQDANFDKLITDIAAIPEFDEMGLNVVDFRDAAWRNERTYSSLFWLLLEQFAQLQGAEIVGEKTPNHLLYMETLQQFFPDARFIHIIRDPRAVVSSWQKVPWSSGSLVGDANVWRNYMRAAQNCSSSVKSALFTLHYEKLISQPEENLQSLCAFLGLEYDPMMMSYYNTESKIVNIAREPWKANSKKPINKLSVERWKTEFSFLMLAKIEKVVWHEMKDLGYQPKNNILSIKLVDFLAKVKRKLVTLAKV